MTTNHPENLTTQKPQTLAAEDSQYRRHTWSELKDIIGTPTQPICFKPPNPTVYFPNPPNNRLETLTRLPSDLHRYQIWSSQIKATHGTVTNYVLTAKLHWTPLPTHSTNASNGPPLFAHHAATPFADPRDYAILVNDWPYGLEAGIKHLLVWTKMPVPILSSGDEGVEGDVTPESRQTIEGFVEQTFMKELGDGGSERVMWFKNWSSLQSVRGVDHVHVLIKDAPPELVEKWTRRKDL
ncbi:hypothetical protein LTR62_006472 [Meristemomyces frigidus]|uniref:N-acetylglucosamine-induced protein 1 n=1 Tax=Meristemomyces frigidus TaxID=1508187 RepID=A0AAN7TNB1_9PEZI|nr:hypothetical protein LTR62_006472 [Meristemomyces frigidus]